MPEQQTIEEKKAEAVVSKMNRSELERFVTLGMEIERREKEEQIRSYVPYDDADYQLDAHKSLAKTKGILGSNRSGKTTFDVAEVEWWATGTHPYRKTPEPPVRIRVCCTDFLNGIEKVMIPKFKEFVVRAGLKGGSWDKAYSKEKRTLTWANGSFAEFMSYDQDVEKYAGPSRHLIVEDEPAPLDIHNENTARLVDVGGERIMSFTPINLDARTSWVYNYWLETSGSKDPDVAWFFFDIYKNKALSKEFIDKFVKSIKDEGEMLARIKGRFPQVAGLIYKNFSESKHVIKDFPIPEHWSRYDGFDPHTRTPTAVLFLATDPENNYYIYDELKQVGTAKLLVDIVKQKNGDHKIHKNISDNSVNDPNEILGRSIWQEFVDPDRDGSQKGIFLITVSNKIKQNMVGIRLITDLLGLDDVYQKPRIFIFKSCVQIIKEFKTYIWDDYRHKQEKQLLERPKKTQGIHLLDCLRYLLMSGVPYVKVAKAEDSEYENPYQFLNRSRSA